MGLRLVIEHNTYVVVMMLQDRLPPDLSLSGMVNKQGAKVRLHFKQDLDQVWIGTKGEYCPSKLHSQKCLTLDLIIILDV